MVPLTYLGDCLYRDNERHCSACRCRICRPVHEWKAGDGTTDPARRVVRMVCADCGSHMVADDD